MRMNESMGINPERDVEEFKEKYDSMLADEFEAGLSAELEKTAQGSPLPDSPEDFVVTTLQGTEGNAEAPQDAIVAPVPESASAPEEEKKIPFFLVEKDISGKKNIPMDAFGNPIKIQDPWGSHEDRHLK